MERCPLCRKGTLALRKYDHVIELGGMKIINGRARAPTCTSCSEALLTSSQLAHYERKAAWLLIRERPEWVDGAVFKFGRKALGLSQAELASRLGYVPETISRWENGSPIEAVAKLALAGLLNDEGPEPSQEAENVLRVV